MTLRDWVARIRRFLSRELWEVEPEARSRLSAVRLLQFSIMLAEGFVRDRLLLRASALTYFTVLSVVPLLAVAVSIASSVGIGSAGFLDWVVETLSGGAPGAAEKIRELVRDVDFAGLGTAGGGVLLVTTVLAISNVEGAFNEIWGVASGRGWMRRFADYLAVLVVAPLLGGLALSLATTLKSRWATSQLSELPGLGMLDAVGTSLVPAAMLAVAFTFLYWFLPNTRVRPLSGAIGGGVAGLLVAGAQSLYLEFSVGAARADALFGGFALLPLLFAWIYVFWAIVLLGAEIAFAHQNFALYRQEVRGDPATPAEREAIGLRMAVEVARCFRSGATAPEPAGLADAFQVPVRTVRAVARQLVEAGLLSARSDAQGGEGLQLARPADTIAVTDVLAALRGGRGARAAGSDASRQVVAALLDDLEGAVVKAAAGRSLAGLVGELDAERGVDPPRARP